MAQPTTLNKNRSRVLGALTITTLKHLGESTLVVDEDNNLCPDWRMARLDDVVLFEKPAAVRPPKRIDCYQVAERGGDALRLDPARLVYSLRLQHKGEPPDFELVLIQDDPEQWVNRSTPRA